MRDGGCNIAAVLAQHAQEIPSHHAVVETRRTWFHRRASYHVMTFKRLDEASDALARGFERIGIKRGTRVALMVTPGLDFVALTFALFKLGAVIVLIDPGMGIRNLGNCLEEAEPQVFIGVSKAHVARLLLRWGGDDLRTFVTVGSRWFWGGYSLDELYDWSDEPYPTANVDADELSAILFTSGSTGPAKGAVYTHGIFLAQVRFLQEIFEFGIGEVDLATFPLFALFDPVLGMTAVIPDMDASRPASADPAKLFEAIDDWGCTQMFGNPALIDGLSRYGEREGKKLPTIKRVISAGAPARPDVLERFQKLLLDDAEIFTPYGATEALPVSSIGSKEILAETQHLTAKGAGTCIGYPNPHIEVSIIEIRDEAIAAWSDSLLVETGQVGEIVVKGPIVTQAYYNRFEQTTLAKIKSGDGTEVYHRMGDVGRFDEQGRLWFFGRKSHRVQTSECTMYSVPCEWIFNQHEKVFRTALVGPGAPGAQKPVLVVELESQFKDAINLEQLRTELLKLGAEFPKTRLIRNVLFHPRFPVDVRHNAKINRELLGRWAAARI